MKPKIINAILAHKKAVPRVLLQARLGGLTTALRKARRDGKNTLP